MAVTHPRLVRAFNRWLERSPEGRARLRNALHWIYVHIEGAPLFVQWLQQTDAGPRIALSDGREEALDVASLRLDAAGTLYCNVRDGTWAAAFGPSAMGAISPFVDAQADALVLRFGDVRVAPPVVDDPLRWPATGKPV
ncbi:MAG: hypothetical protein ACPGUV_05230 [Polyangiales bacterium]